APARALPPRLGAADRAQRRDRRAAADARHGGRRPGPRVRRRAAPVRGAAPADGGAAAEGARRGLPPLRLRPDLRGDRPRARPVARGRAPGGVVRRPPPSSRGALMTTVPAELDRRFRDAAAAEGLLDVAYELHDSPVGTLFVAVTDRGVCEIHYDADPDAEADRLARLFGTRVLRSPRPTDEARRQLDEYFAGSRHEFDL